MTRKRTKSNMTLQPAAVSEALVQQIMQQWNTLAPEIPAAFHTLISHLGEVYHHTIIDTGLRHASQRDGHHAFVQQLVDKLRHICEAQHRGAVNEAICLAMEFGAIASALGFKLLHEDDALQGTGVRKARRKGAQASAQRSTKEAQKRYAQWGEEDKRLQKDEPSLGPWQRAGRIAWRHDVKQDAVYRALHKPQ